MVNVELLKDLLLSVPERLNKLERLRADLLFLSNSSVIGVNVELPTRSSEGVIEPNVSRQGF